MTTTLRERTAHTEQAWDIVIALAARAAATNQHATINRAACEVVISWPGGQWSKVHATPLPGPDRQWQVIAYTDDPDALPASIERVVADDVVDTMLHWAAKMDERAATRARGAHPAPVDFIDALIATPCSACPATATIGYVPAGRDDVTTVAWCPTCATLTTHTAPTNTETSPR